MIEIRELDKEEMQKGDEEGFLLVEVKEDYEGSFSPHCKIHGAMNKFPNGIWRCLSEYGYEKKEGNSLPTFRDRVCKACCREK